MKIVLMVPFTPLVKEPPVFPDLGLGYIAASLKKKGHQVSVMDWNMNPSVDALKRRLLLDKPDIAGIKIFTKDVGPALKTISLVKETLPHAITVIGGPHPSAAVPGDLMEDFSQVDFAIRGEAETSFPLLVSEIEKGLTSGSASESNVSVKNISGLVYRENNTTHANPISFTEKLDDIDLPCWDLMNPKDYVSSSFTMSKNKGNIAPIITTRGCPGKCIFCGVHKVNGRLIRYRSPENVFEEIKILHDRYDVRTLAFQDNCFTSDIGHLMAICDLIIKSGFRFEWDCSSYERIDNINKETLAVMKKAGCSIIHLGIESGSEAIRKIINKSGSLDDIREKARLIKESGIKLGAWFMLGFPDETREDMEDTIKYAFSLNADLLTFTPCFPLPGTEVYHYVKKKHNFQKIDWGNFDIFRSEYPISRLSSAQLTMMIKKLRFRLKLQSKLKRLKKLFS